MEKLSKCCDKYFILGVPKSSNYLINHITLHYYYYYYYYYYYEIVFVVLVKVTNPVAL